MSNFDEVKAGGWVDGNNVTGPEVTGLQSRILKAVNGDDGSSHAGAVTLGQIISSQHRHKYLASGPHSAASVTVNVDLDLYSFVDLTRSRNTSGGSLTVAFSNVRQGGVYFLLYRTASPDPGGFQDDYQLTLGGSGITHYHSNREGASADQALSVFGWDEIAGQLCLPGRTNLNSVPVNGVLTFPFTPPPGCLINSVHARIDPVNDTLPTTNPKIELVYWGTSGDSVETIVATQTDPLTGASYQAPHWLEALTIDHQTLDEGAAQSRQYCIRVYGEVGGDADPFLLQHLKFNRSLSEVRARHDSGAMLLMGVAASDTRIFWHCLARDEGASAIY